MKLYMLHIHISLKNNGIYMKQVLLSKVNKQSYSPTESTSIDMDILGCFLVDNIKDSVDIRDALDDPWTKMYSSYETYYIKIGNKITIGYNDFFGEPDKETFEITQERLEYVLSRFEKLYQKKPMPSKIIITKENNTITLDGIN